MTFRRSFAVHSLLAFSLAAPLFASRPALADEACGDQVCPKGFHCETYDLGCPAIDCAEGSECTPCEPGTASACAPSPCTSNADCAADMQCFTETHQECDDVGGCARPDPGDGAEVPPDCVEAEPTNCATVSTSSCVPRWALPCQLASDCGPGFTCEELMQGGCPGSMGSGGGSTPSDGSAPATPTPEPADGGAGDADPGFAPPPDEKPGSDGGTDGCVFEPSGEFACVRVEVGCQSDADCLEGWSCDDNHEGSCWSSSDGSTGCDPVDPPKVCYPPYEDLGGRGIAGGDSETGSNDGGSQGGPSGGPVAPAAPSEDAAADDNDSETRTVRTGGCAVSPAATGGAGFGLLALALAGLLGARRRR